MAQIAESTAISFAVSVKPPEAQILGRVAFVQPRAHRHCPAAKLRHESQGNLRGRDIVGLRNRLSHSVAQHSPAIQRGSN